MDATTQTEAIDSSLGQKHQYQCLKCPKHFATPSALARHTKDKHPSKPKHKLASPELNQSTDNTFHKPTYKPPILEEPSCPPNFRVFFNLKAKTRKVPPNVKSYTRFVAPRFPLTMLQLAERVHFPDLLSKEFVAFAQAYDTIVKRKDFASTTTVCQYPIGVTNSKQDLVLTGRCRILKDLERKAPSLPTKNLKILTEDTVTQFFAEARIYMLLHGIPWDDFPAYFMTASVLGAEISCKVTNVLHGYPADDRYLVRNFSCFIERIILGLLPLEECYYDAELRILQKHKQHLTGPNPSIDFTRTYIHSDAQELTTKSPYYKQVHNEITDEQLKRMIKNEETNLLHKIITHTSYDAKIHKLLIASSKYKEITDVPNNELLDNLQSLMVAEEKAAIALVNATKLSPLSSTPQTTRHGRTQSTTASSEARNRSQSRGSNSRGARRQTPIRSASCSPQTRRNLSNRHPSYSPERRRSTSELQLQERCNTCLKLNMPEDFCHKNRHCRQDGHQPEYRKSSELERRVQRNEPDTFVIYDNCTKCFPPTTGATKWLLGNTPSLMLPPPNLFNRPPPTYLNVPPPNYFRAPPPNLKSRPPPNIPERVKLDHWNRF